MLSLSSHDHQEYFCTFVRRYDVAMDINTMGPFRIMSFAQRFRRLKLFLQVSTGKAVRVQNILWRKAPIFLVNFQSLQASSAMCVECCVCQTAYVNGQRQGLVLEKPFRMGDTIAKELESSEQKSSTVLDIEAEIKLAFDYSRRHSVDSASFAQEMKGLGLQRYTVHKMIVFFICPTSLLNDPSRSKMK